MASKKTYKVKLIIESDATKQWKDLADLDNEDGLLVSVPHMNDAPTYADLKEQIDTHVWQQHGAECQIDKITRMKDMEETSLSRDTLLEDALEDHYGSDSNPESDDNMAVIVRVTHKEEKDKEEQEDNGMHVSMFIRIVTNCQHSDFGLIFFVFRALFRVFHVAFHSTSFYLFCVCLHLHNNILVYIIR